MSAASPEPFRADPPDRFSMTLLRTAEQRCPLAARMSRDPGGDATGEDAVLGRLFHEAAAAVGFAAIAQDAEQVNVGQAMDVARSALRRPADPEALGWHHYTALLDMVESWATTARFRPDADMQAVERLYQTRLAGGQLVSGKLDRLTIVGDTAEVRDYKTGPGFPSEARVVAGPQLRQYALQVMRRHPEVNLVVGVEEYTAHQMELPAGGLLIDRAEAERFGQYLDDAATRLRAMWEQDTFPPRPGSWCAWCPAPDRCPLPKRARPWSITTREEAIEQAEAVCAAEAEVKRRRHAIEAAMDANEWEPLPVGDRLMGFTQKPVTRFNKEAARRAGLPLGQYETTKVQREFGWRSNRG